MMIVSIIRDQLDQQQTERAPDYPVGYVWFSGERWFEDKLPGQFVLRYTPRAIEIDDLWEILASL